MALPQRREQSGELQGNLNSVRSGADGDKAQLVESGGRLGKEQQVGKGLVWDVLRAAGQSRVQIE